MKKTMSNDKEKSIDPKDLSQHETFERKEVYQFKQPGDTAKPLEHGESDSSTWDEKESEKASKEEGLNEEKSSGTEGAFEGFEARRQVDDEA
ncbi:MAG: hypothetical protein ABJA90_06525 [Ginsengibacter sp.]